MWWRPRRYKHESAPCASGDPNPALVVRVQSLDSSTVPRRKPTWITVGEDRRVLTIRPIYGYLDIDEVFLTTSVHDFPDPAARRFSPTNAFRFGRIGP